MNSNKAQEIINQIVAEYRKNSGDAGRRQYPASKKYIKQAEELGILHMIPDAPGANVSHIGNTEIQIILAAATDNGSNTAVFNAYGEGEEIHTKPHALYLAINEEPEPAPEPDYNEILDDVSVYVESCQAEYFDHIYEVMEGQYEGDELRDAIRKLKAQIARGRRLQESGYSVRLSSRHIEGTALENGEDIPGEALAWRKQWSGYLANSPSFRWQYLIKRNA